jgi:hypothetical protein
MKKWIPGIFLSIAVAACLMAASCEKYILPRLECDTDTIWAPVEGGLFNVTISSNVSWAFDAETIFSWIWIDVSYAENEYVDTDYPIQIKVSASEQSSDRECVMKFTSTTLARQLVVYQKGTGIEPEPEPDETPDTQE